MLSAGVDAAVNFVSANSFIFEIYCALCYPGLFDCCQANSFGISVPLSYRHIRMYVRVCAEFLGLWCLNPKYVEINVVMKFI